MKNTIIIFSLLAIFTSCKHQKTNQKTSDETLKNQDTMFIDKRHIAIHNVDNFRDLGGYPTKDEKTVKWGKLYRAGELSKLDHSNFKLLDSLQIEKVYDFRTNPEIKEKPDTLPESVEYIHLPIGEESWTNSKSFFSELVNQQNPDSVEVWILGLYKTIPVRYSDQYRTFFNSLVNDDKPIIYHCTAGKDRTGIASALLLYMLDVPMSYIKADYALSNHYRADVNKKYAKMLEEESGVKHDNMMKIMQVQPEYISEIFNHINEIYGSLDTYISEELDISEEDIIRLREKFTE